MPSEFAKAKVLEKVIMVEDPLSKARDAACALLLQFVESKGLVVSPKHRPPRGAPCIYPLQGANPTDAVLAFDAFPPDMQNVPQRIQQQIISGAKSHNRSFKFTEPPQTIGAIIKALYQNALQKVAGSPLFPGVHPNTTCLGYVEFIMQRGGVPINPHKDPPNECDWCAIYCFQGSTECTVDGEHFLLGRGDMYVFSPVQQRHSVGLPHNNVTRYAVALRCYNYAQGEVDGKSAVWSPKLLQEDERERRLQQHKKVSQKRLDNWTPPSAWSCTSCGTHNLDYIQTCVNPVCGCPRRTLHTARENAHNVRVDLGTGDTQERESTEVGDEQNSGQVGASDPVQRGQGIHEDVEDRGVGATDLCSADDEEGGKVGASDVCGAVNDEGGKRGQGNEEDLSNIRQHAGTDRNEIVQGGEQSTPGSTPGEKEGYGKEPENGKGGNRGRCEKGQGEPRTAPMKKKRRETCPQLPKRLPGRPKGSGNVVMRASEMTFPINKDKFDSYWAKHRVRCVAGPQLMCTMFKKGGTGRCCHTTIWHEPESKMCSNFCGECALPFHPECLMMWHLFIDQGFAAEEWMTACFQRIWKESNLHPPRLEKAIPKG